MLNDSIAAISFVIPLHPHQSSIFDIL